VIVTDDKCTLVDAEHNKNLTENVAKDWYTLLAFTGRVNVILCAQARYTVTGVLLSVGHQCVTVRLLC